MSKSRADGPSPSASASEPDALAAWADIPALVHALVDGLDDTLGQARGDAFGAAALDARPEPHALSTREVVHHIAEANVVAASIVIAALGSPGCTYDWSWMLPFGPWMQRLAYEHKPLAPTLALVDALNAYVVAQLAPLADGLAREVRLRDRPDGPLRSVTVADVLRQEAEHAREHVEAARAGRAARR